MDFEQVCEKLSNIDPFIQYLEKTDPNDWTMDVVRTKDGKNCLLGHLVNWFYGKDYEGNIMDAWDWFNEIWATEYMFYPVNDGENPKYQQPTSKERCIAYLKDLRDGKEKTTPQLLKELS